MTEKISAVVENLFFGAVTDQLVRKTLSIAFQGVTQLVVSNTSFFIVRLVLSGFIYTVYQLGRDVVFSLLLVFVVLGASASTFAFYRAGLSIEVFLRGQRELAVGTILIVSISIWYWRRYVFRGDNNRTVFDHEVGAALVGLRR